MVREGQRKLSWRVPECLMGLPDNSKETNWRIVIFYSLWNGGRHSNRNWSTHKTYNFSRRKHPFSLNRVCFGPNQQKVGWDDHKMPAYHQRVMVQYNRRVWSRKFHLRDLILQYVFKNTKKSRDAKLGPNWEGPYQVTWVGPNDAYHLEALDSKALLSPWNVLHLKKFCPWKLFLNINSMSLKCTLVFI